MSLSTARSLAVSLWALSVLNGCGWITALDVRYPEAAVNPSMLAAIAPRKVVVGAITDRRLEQTRVGATPKDGDAITTRRPVIEIVRGALAAEITKNGHAVVADAGDIILAADVEEFWLDIVGRDSTTLYIGRVAIAVAVADGRTGNPLLTRRYLGVKRREGEADSRTIRREVLDHALARTLHDLATDPEFVATFARRSTADSERSRYSHLTRLRSQTQSE
jgi:hypothetical protein